MADPRVIFVNRVYWPSTAATAQLLTDLAEGLAAAGWTVHVIAAGENSTHHNGVTIHRTGDTDRHGGMLSRAVNYGRFRRAAQRLLKTLVQPGDVVVPMTDPPLLGTAVTDLVTARGGAVVPWIQDVYPEILSSHLGGWSAALLDPLRTRRNRAWRAARCCVTLGEDMAQTLAAGGVPAERIALIPNWAPRELQVPASSDAIAARRQAWDVAEKFVVAYSGNLGRVHEFNAALEAAAQLREQRDIVFLFIGTGARFGEVSAAARARGLDNVRLLPPESRENLPAALAAADAHLVTLKPAFAKLVYPSKLAGVLAAARPVLFVGPTDGEIARLLAQAQCGAAVAPAEGAKLAGLVAAWHKDPAGARLLGARGRAVYEARFAAGPALDRWQEVLRRAAKKI
jgi:colanic acid biosynthesis glycosyl transferase WcaI